MEKQPDIAEHIQDALEGRQAAFSYLLTTFWSQVYAFQLKRTKDDYISEEITIQTFSQAFSHLGQYDPNHKFSTWLLAISKNIHIDRLRKEKGKRHIESGTNAENLNRIIDDSPTPEDALIKKQHHDELSHFIKQLKPPYQEVLDLRYFQDMSYKEMSGHLREPMNNVKVRLLRARRLLADSIQKK
ncbi:RNA polymerase sigma factor [Flavimarina sp. Hel_I_48]|uniref:RNA polymerase sigma factor n=1 Tax=Flavimarina sp. Hel_I_48 TaxID=1392488 RepID=UPI0004DFA098|nr:sigma-70 family RNA polymerase sigma factor [Flavimarina sp. Hel_I_48]